MSNNNNNNNDNNNRHQPDPPRPGGPVFELPGDLPPVPTPLSELPVPTPYSEFSNFSSDRSYLKPAPLNFSRPRPRHQESSQAVPRPRPASYHEDSTSTTNPPSRTDYDPVSTVPLYHTTNPRNSNDYDDDDAAEPPPTIRTNTRSTSERHSFESYDSAQPPPVRTATHSQSSSLSRINLFPRRPSRPSLAPNGPSPYESREPRTWIYKPYAMSQASTTPSHRDSIASDADTADTASTAETVDTDASGTTGYSSASDFAFDGQLGWNPRTMPGVTAENQRQRWSGFGSSLAGVRTQSSGPLNNRDNSVPSSHESSNVSSSRPLIPTRTNESTASTSTTSTDRNGSIYELPGSIPHRPHPRNNATNNPSTTSLAQQPTNASTASTSSASLASTTTTNNNNNSARPPKPPPRLPRIVKRTSVDQMSEHVDLTHGDGMSDAGSASSSEWRGSDHDTSGLSVEQIHKLKKKGINPALYAEMKAARKGSGKKRWAPTLAGNAFLG